MGAGPECLVHPLRGSDGTLGPEPRADSEPRAAGPALGRHSVLGKKGRRASGPGQNPDPRKLKSTLGAFFLSPKASPLASHTSFKTPPPPQRRPRHFIPLPSSPPAPPKPQRLVFLGLSPLGPHHPPGQPAGARGLLSRSPVKCSSSAHLLPVPALVWGPHRERSHRELSGKISPSATWEALAGWGQPSPSASSCFLSQENRSTFPACGRARGQSCLWPAEEQAGEQCWATGFWEAPKAVPGPRWAGGCEALAQFLEGGVEMKSLERGRWGRGQGPAPRAQPTRAGE